MIEEKSLEDQCQSFVKDNGKELVQCKNVGERRYNNGLYSGIHCDDCWNEIIYNARKKSW